MSFLFILFVIALVVYIAWRPKKKQLTSFPAGWKKILEERVDYYRQLHANQKEQFCMDVMKFLAGVRITGVQTEVDITDKLLVASSAVIPVLGFPDWEYSFLDEVLLYPTSFDRELNIGSKTEFITGMVGNGSMEGKMILSKKALHYGFSNSRDKKNVGIHEFIHLLDKEDGIVDGIPTSLNDKPYCLPWLTLMSAKMERMRVKQTGINIYGATNEKEFLAVAGEYFFERPHLLQSKHPDLYEMLSKAFQQDPTEIIDAKQKVRKSIGRNDPCPCGSGKKFKRCCLLN